jgi:plasmid stability protein
MRCLCWAANAKSSRRGIRQSALTPGVVCEDLEREERYTLTHEEAREDPESEVRNPRDDVKSGSKLYASANHIESHKAEAKDMGKARVATGRVPILSASVKKPEKENRKTNGTSQFEATLTLGKRGGNHIECHKVEALKDMSKARTATKSTPGQCKRINDDWRKVVALRYLEGTKDLEPTLEAKTGELWISVYYSTETQKDMGETWKTKPNEQSCPIDDRLCDVPCELAQGIKDERQRKEPWILRESRAMTSWETGVCWRYIPMTHDQMEVTSGTRKTMDILLDICCQD